MDIVSYLLGKQSGGGSSPSGDKAIEKDVNFYDYDGTRLYSYTKNEFLGLSALPENPTHTGLTAQGWNWSYEDAISYVTKYGCLDIGQLYITDDEKTRIYINLSDSRKSPYLGVGLNGTMTIDWGDNSTDTITGSSLSTVTSIQHNYATGGKYIIVLTLGENSTFKILGQGGSGLVGGSMLLWNNVESTAALTTNRAYINAIEKIELGKGITGIGNYGLGQMNSLKSINFPNSITELGDYSCSILSSINILIFPTSVTTLGSYCAFNSTISKIVLSNSITSIGSTGLSGFYTLKTIILPQGITELASNLLNNNYGATKFIIPENVTKINNNCFSNNCSVKYYDFSHLTSIPTLTNTNAFNNIATDCKIIVPDSLYTSWTSANNWVTYSSYIIKASEA